MFNVATPNSDGLGRPHQSEYSLEVSKFHLSGSSQAQPIQELEDYITGKYGLKP
jgi:hypothetical protein